MRAKCERERGRPPIRGALVPRVAWPQAPQKVRPGARGVGPPGRRHKIDSMRNNVVFQKFPQFVKFVNGMSSELLMAIVFPIALHGSSLQLFAHVRQCSDDDDDDPEEQI